MPYIKGVQASEFLKVVFLGYFPENYFFVLKILKTNLFFFALNSCK